MSRNASTEIGLLDVSRVYLLVRLDALTVLETPTDTSAKSFFSEIVASISDIKSTPDEVLVSVSHWPKTAVPSNPDVKIRKYKKQFYN